jgi:peroxin-13
MGGGMGYGGYGSSMYGGMGSSMYGGMGSSMYGGYGGMGYGGGMDPNDPQTLSRRMETGTQGLSSEDTDDSDVSDY